MFQESSVDFSTSKLNKVTQLTGFSDPVYAEAYVHVNQVTLLFLILLYVLINSLLSKHNEHLNTCFDQLARFFMDGCCIKTSKYAVTKESQKIPRVFFFVIAHSHVEGF